MTSISVDVQPLLREAAAATSFVEQQSTGRALMAAGQSSLETAGLRSVRIALLSSATIEPLVPLLYVACANERLAPSVYVAGFNQYSQELLNPSSELYSENPEIAFLFAELDSLVPGVVGASAPRHPRPG